MRITPTYPLLALALLASPTFAQTLAGTALPRGPQTVLKVTSYADDGGEGTLRSVLERNNANPGRYRIELSAIGAGPYVIKPTRELPPIKGPVVIENVDWARNGTYVAIDGSAYVVGPGTRACPGAVPGQYGTNVRTTTKPGLILRDTEAVEIRGLEISNFCIGILVNRASGNLIHDNRIVGNKGGAGIMVTGDDGKGNSTATTTVDNKILRNRFVNNGDAMEMTRGAAFNLIADNFITSNDKDNEEPSQGLEILWGNDNVVVHNYWENLSDGVQLNWGNRNYISGNTFTGISSAVTLSGSGNIVDGNTMIGNRVAVSVRPQAEPGADAAPGRNRVTGPAINTISANVMIDNGKDIRRCYAGGSCLPELKGAIVFDVPGLEHGRFIGNRGGGVESDPSKLETICALDGPVAGCEPSPNHGQRAPTLLATLAASQGGIGVRGEFQGLANTLYRVELFANSKPGMIEAERYLGYIQVPVDAKGHASFVFQLNSADAANTANVTATVTSADGATSPLSQPLPLPLSQASSTAAAAATVPAVLPAQSAKTSALSTTPADLYTGKTMTGNWNGKRSEWAADGVTFRGGFITEAMGVVDGGVRRSARNAFQTQLGVDLDMGKLTDSWGDARFHLTINDRRGRSTSDELAANNYMPIQEIYSDQFTRLTELSYDQNFLDKKLNWKAGFYVMGNDFGINQIMTNFVNAALCAHPISLSTSAGWTNWPRPRWATHLTVHPTPEITVRGGMVLVNTNYNLEKNRWSLNEDGTTGHLYPVEVEWAPGTADHGNFPGHYKLGYYYDTSHTKMVGTRSSEIAGHREGGYVMIDQKVTNNEVNGGLSLFAQYTAQSQQTAVMHRWGSAGLVYQGLFNSRPLDRVAVGYVRASINRNLQQQQLRNQQAGLITDADWELNPAEALWEVAYTFQVNPWLSIRPDIQYITKPGTFRYKNTDNVLAMGVQAKITF
jgi:carbohydrate-selective porin OprB/nitrous oxidase accessory protein NosD